MASLRSLVETALSSALATIDTANIYTGLDDGDKEMPCIICRAVSADESSHQTGNYDVTIEVIVKALPGDEFDTITESVRDLIKTDALVTALNITGLKVWGIAGEDSMAWGFDGDAWTETVQFKIACAAHTFS